MKKELTCIGCPIGCHLTADLDSTSVSNIQGNGCNIGKKYAQEELTHPTRMVTSLMQVSGTHRPLSVKTTKPVPKEMIFACLEEIAAHTVIAPIHIGEVIIQNVCGTGVDVVATKELW